MTVKELKEWLNEYSDDAECFVFDSEVGEDRPMNQYNFSIKGKTKTDEQD